MSVLTHTGARAERRRQDGRAQHPSCGSLTSDALAEMASELAATTEPWEVRAGHAPAERCYERVLACASYEVWVIYWPTGGVLDLHDHGGSAGAFSVVAGHLDEAHLECGRTVVRQLGPGDSVGFSARHVHAVANSSDAPATSVHVYSPPLGPMSFFGRDVDGRLVQID
jgi:mannose-6-phosphate isomerase-like protein (cupin superfamily)